MSVGTPNFVGERLKEAREARGLTGVALADLVGVKRASISLYELGKASPQFEVMLNLARVLNVPRAFFIRPLTQPDTDILFYRSMSAATKSDRIKARRKYTWLKQMTSYLRGYVRFPQINIPQLDVPPEIIAIDTNVITLAASQTRKFWGLGDGPISDVTLLLENNGVIASKVTLNTMHMDGFSSWDESSRTPYVILGDDKGSAVRSRFDAAHELGHLILHRTLLPQSISNPINNKVIEFQANEFASAFLLPEETFAEDLYFVSLDSLKALKSKWLVSISAMLRRAAALDMTTEKQTKGLWVNLTRRGWKTKEPLDDQLVPEYPRLLRRAFELIKNKGVQEPEQIISDLCLSSSDISELACVEANFFVTRAHSRDLILEDFNHRDLNSTEEYLISGEVPQSLN